MSTRIAASQLATGNVVKIARPVYADIDTATRWDWQQVRDLSTAGDRIVASLWIGTSRQYEETQSWALGEQVEILTAAEADALAEVDRTAQTVRDDEMRLTGAQQYRAEAIFRAREAGMSATDLADRTGLNVSRIYQILH